MMKSIFPVILFSAFSSPAALALHETNCSNADASIKRSEQEIWGANLVEWTYKGEAIEANNVHVEWQLRRIISSEESNDPNDAFYRTETFTVEVALTTPQGDVLKDTLLCYAWENSAID